jgi:surface polysaccharide O-acyltransferase-like enzyme
MALFWVSGKPILDLFFSVFKGPITTHLWYLYAILGLTIFIPFLGKVYKNSTEIERRIFIAIWFLVSSITPLAVDLLGMAWNPVSVYGFEPFTGYMGLCFLGAYLYDKRKERVTAWAVYNLLGFLVVGMFIALLTFWVSVRRGVPVEVFYGYRTFFVVISAACLFNFAICLPKINGLPARVIRVVSDCSLGIYCIHPLVIYVATKWWGEQLVVGWLPVPLMAASVFVVSALVVRLGRLIPIIRHVA